MRSTVLTALLFALFALFYTVAYAAPVSPQGVISLSPTPHRVQYDVITNLLGLLSNSPGAPQQTAVTASESSSAPITQPTVSRTSTLYETRFCPAGFTVSRLLLLS
ncbi:hypothetical protein DFH94DRAFT_684557 [Russula ochroleuca]|uniref:Uncharacterized protein n=1 Tax=Russula ochroleuca TaxID=152965 RepID=A0A9P5JYW4_9AGAM|nr:hypothetical protein DFH94DRAFT_684557 [Russula ochroleuca]